LKNNLRDLRKRGRWSQAEIGERVGVAHNTVSLYESGKLPLTDEIAARFAKALGVGPREIEIVSELSAKEDAIPYRTMSIPVALLSTELLQQIKGYLSQKLEHTQGRDYQQLLETLGSIGAELDARPAVILHEK
jgi:transcriptional regulator with XRE-family HTH domain